MNGTSSSDKGKRGEREVVALYETHVGVTPRRTLAGHRDDRGDLTGVPDTTVEIKNMTSLSAAINEGLADLAREHANSGTPHAVLWVRRRGGNWIAIQTPEQHFALWREAVETKAET
jgi:hypothetical protein